MTRTTHSINDLIDRKASGRKEYYYLLQNPH